jgi:hypothetical protein
LTKPSVPTTSDRIIPTRQRGVQFSTDIQVEKNKAAPPGRAGNAMRMRMRISVRCENFWQFALMRMRCECKFQSASHSHSHFNSHFYIFSFEEA